MFAPVPAIPTMTAHRWRSPARALSGCPGAADTDRPRSPRAAARRLPKYAAKGGRWTRLPPEHGRRLHRSRAGRHLCRVLALGPERGEALARSRPYEIEAKVVSCLCPVERLAAVLAAF